jgi:hypothetical protein
MSTVFVPEIGEATVETVLATRAAITNLPPEGTRIRATLGETVLVGRLTHELANKDYFYIHLDPIPDATDNHEGWRHYSIYLPSGWTFEILDTDEVAS